MEYKNFMSKMEDVVWLAYKLKDELGDKISINKIGLYKEFLEGVYNLDGNRSVDFCVLYSDKEFMRVCVGEMRVSFSYEDKVFVLNKIGTAIGNIVRNGVSLGEPTIFYNVKDEEYMVPHLEYCYAQKEGAIKAFKDKTIFDDGIPYDVVVFDDLKEGNKFYFEKFYSYSDVTTKSEYIISIKAILNNRSNIENRVVKGLVRENLDNLFICDNMMARYVSENCNIESVIGYIKDALYLTGEVELIVTITRDSKEICNVRYMNEELTKYSSSVCDGMLELETFYDYDKGMNFRTNCGIKKGYEFMSKSICNELDRVKRLVYGNVKPNLSNQNLLRLVRRIGNK